MITFPKVWLFAYLTEIRFLTFKFSGNNISNTRKPCISPSLKLSYVTFEIWISCRRNAFFSIFTLKKCILTCCHQWIWARAFCVAGAVFCDGCKNISFIFSGRRAGFSRLLMSLKCECSFCCFVVHVFPCFSFNGRLFVFKSFNVMDFFVSVMFPFFVLGGGAIITFSPRLSCCALKLPVAPTSTKKVSQDP